jgi:transmembrane sensor
MTGTQAMIDEPALAWVICTRDANFTDWTGFTAWLEADAAHAAAYDRLAALDALLPMVLPQGPAVPSPANDPGEGGIGRKPRGRRWPAMLAVAAALVAIVTVSVVPRADPYTISTSAGQTRELALPDGTLVAMNHGTTLRLDHNAPRLVSLERGEATFTVTHDARHPFRVTVGPAVFEDVGTIFNISRTGEVTRIGVGEGAVIYNPDGQGIALLAGRSLRVAGDALTIGTISPQAVASWREGRLVYDNASVADIAGDIARNLGVGVQASGGAGALRFTGTILLKRDPQAFFRTAAPLLGVYAERGREGWLLKAHDAAGD